MTATPLPEKAVINTHIPTGIKIYGYTTEQLRAYGAAEYKRGNDKEAALVTALQRMTDALDQATKERGALKVRLQEVVNTFANEIDTLRAERDRYQEAMFSWVKANSEGGWIDDLSTKCDRLEVALEDAERRVMNRTIATRVAMKGTS